MVSQSGPVMSAILGTREYHSIGDDVTFRCYRKKLPPYSKIDRSIYLESNNLQVFCFRFIQLERSPIDF